MGRIRFSGRPGKRTDADGNLLGTYLDSLSVPERKKLLIAYGLDEKDDFKDKVRNIMLYKKIILIKF